MVAARRRGDDDEVARLYAVWLGDVCVLLMMYVWYVFVVKVCGCVVSDVVVFEVMFC